MTKFFMFLNVSSVYSNLLMNSSLQKYVFDGGAAQSMTLTFDLCMCVCVCEFCRQKTSR